MNTNPRYDIAVVGGGIAGITAAAYAARSGKSVALFEQSDHVGGLAGSFVHEGFTLDFGIRAFENSGIVKPMLRQLGIDPQFVKSPVKIGIGEDFVELRGKESLEDYRALLKRHFPASQEDVDRILKDIEAVMGYMDVLYGIDNPLFLDTMDSAYLINTLLPWLFKYQKNVKKAQALNKPIREHLAGLTDNEALIDMIAQHFFQDTPSFFALSYFSLYLDYNYPKGGTRGLIDKLVAYLVEHGVTIHKNCRIEDVNPAAHTIESEDGRSFEYKAMIWCADQTALYENIDVSELPARLQKKVTQHNAFLSDKTGGDSVFTVYLLVDEDKEQFRRLFGTHSFYTPNALGVGKKTPFDATLQEDKDTLFCAILKPYFENTTYEVSIPVLRDPSLAPEGKTALIVSVLMDYRLAKHALEKGWLDELKNQGAKWTIEALKPVCGNLLDTARPAMISTPLTIERFTKNRHGAITGWAFTNKELPCVSGFKDVMKSVDTPFKDIFQAGQWTFAPSGFPVSIMTGKIASDKAKKAIKRK
jgi:phytoene dehydrogenase-like protein